MSGKSFLIATVLATTDLIQSRPSVILRTWVGCLVMEAVALRILQQEAGPMERTTSQGTPKSSA